MFYEIKFPESLSNEILINYSFDTTISTSKNGIEQRSSNRENDKISYNITNVFASIESLEKFLSFFRIVKGKATGFRFKNILDFKIENQFIGISDGSTKNFQIIKSYNYNNYAYTKKITKLVPGTVKIFVNGINYTGLTEINYNNGIITFNNVPENNSTITANFEFDIPVRFDNDNIEIILDSKNSGKIKNIKLIEIF